MRINLLVALLLICGVAKAQTLKLKKGQKFSYEAINEVEWNDEYKNKSYEYWQSTLEVTSRNKDTYTLRVSPSIILTKWGDDILDSTVPLEEQPAIFMAVVKKALTMSSYFITVDQNGKIISTTGMSEIRSDIATKLKALNIPEDHQKHADLLIKFVLRTFSNYMELSFMLKADLQTEMLKAELSLPIQKILQPRTFLRKAF
jgi:hypothetical protein